MESKNEKTIKKVVKKETPVKVAVKKEAVKVSEKKSTKKTFVGTVVSDKMQKTVVVSIQRRVAHPVYGKLIKITKRFKADTNGMEVKVGQTIRMEETRPISKGKFFKVIEIIKEGDKK